MMTGLVVVLGVLYFVALLAPIEYSARLWGISQLTYIEWGARGMILAMALLVPLVTFNVVRRVNLGKVGNGLLIYVLLPALLLGLFYLLRVKTHYLGDGILRSREIEHDVWYLPTEPLGVFVNYLSYKVTGRLFNFTPLQAMEVVSYLGGLLYYYVCLYLARTLFKTSSERSLSFFLLFFSGTTLLFCGYAETYSLLPAGYALFLALGMKALTSGRHLLIAVLLYVLLIMFHFASFFLAPSLLYLAYRQYRQGHMTRSILTGATVPILIVVAFLVSRTTEHSMVGIGHYLMPFVPGEESYWLLSGQHLLDIANELMLTAMAPLILLSGLVLFRLIPKLKQTHDTLFVLAAVPGVLLFMFLLDPKLGYASDWDLFSSAGVIITIATLAILSRTKPFKISKSAAVSLGAVGLAAFFSFAAVNAEYDRSMDREVDILSLYGERGGIGFETIGNHLNMIGDKETAERMWRRALRYKPHRRTYSNLGQLMSNQGRYSEALYYLTEGLKLDSTYALLHMNLGRVYGDMKKPEQAEPHLRKAVELDPDDPVFRHNLAFFLLTQGRYEESESEARLAVRLDPRNATFACGLGVCLAALGRGEEAREQFVTADRLQPGFPQAYYGLARLLISEGKIATARRLCQDYLDRNPPPSVRGRFERILSELPPADTAIPDTFRIE